jgi:predicted protein tyrosine phosphatase
MSSPSNPPRNPNTLPAGEYYLVDIQEMVDVYNAAPEAVRAVGTDGVGLTDKEMIDVNLSALIPCLDDREDAEVEINKHAEEMLQQFAEEQAIELDKRGVNTEERIMPNTFEQLEYANLVVKMGRSLKTVLEDNGLYDERGALKVEHCIVREDDNTLILRRSN